MPLRMLKKDEDEKKQNKKKKPKGSSKLDIFKSYGKYDGKPMELRRGGISRTNKLRAEKGQFTIEGRMQSLREKLKKKFGKPKLKRGGETPGLKDYVKKSDRIKKILRVLDSKTGQETFVSRNEIMTSGDRYKPVKGGVKNYVSELARQNQKRTGGAMLKNPGKADLDKDGKLSGYEKKRGMAIEKAMSGKRFGGAIRGFGAARRKGMGLQDERVKPGKVMKAKRGKMGVKGKRALGPQSEFGAYNKMRDQMEDQRKMMQRMEEMKKDKKRLKQMKKGIAVKKGGMMKYTKGGGADTGRMGEIKSKLATLKGRLKGLGRQPKGKLTPEQIEDLRKKFKFDKPKTMIPLAKKMKKMGGGLTEATRRLNAQGYKKGGIKGKKPIIKIAIGVGKAKDYPGIKKIMEMNKRGKKRFNTGGSVSVSTKLGRTKPTKLY
jgi:hypothetical protein